MSCSQKENKQMSNDKQALLRANLKQLRLPTMAAEFEKLAREAAAANESFEQYLLRLTELEVAARGSKALQARIRQAGFPVAKDFDTFDFSCVPHMNKPKMLELARGEWIEQKMNVCLVGSPGTGKTHLATALGLAGCRQGKRVRFFTAAKLVTKLEQAQKQYQLDRLLSQLDKTDLLICDELGYLSFSKSGAELLFQVFAERYERRSLLLTSNLAFSEWGQVFQGERMTAALLDRLTHRCNIFEMNGESFRFRESMKSKKKKSSD
jgi:DNA replication protein DnaC